MVTTASLILHETETLILLLSSGSLDHLAGGHRLFLWKLEVFELVGWVREKRKW